MASRRKIQQMAYSLISEYTAPPIPIKDVIKGLGIKLLPYDMDDGVSGILMIEKDNSTIGYSKSEGAERQRFTMAHELGHYMLHRHGDLFIDKEFKTMYRPSSSTPSTEWQEWEANEFAACVLMPEHLVKAEMEEIQMDYDDNQWISKLAKKFKVSPSAMSIRVARLGL